MSNLMLIGQFAELAGISRRMLRHYEKMALITPFIVVEDIDERTVTALVEATLKDVRSFDFSPYGCPDCMTCSCGVYLFKTYEHSQEPRHESGITFMDVKRAGGNGYKVLNTIH